MFPSFSTPDVPLDLQEVESKIEGFKTFTKRMDENSVLTTIMKILKTQMQLVLLWLRLVLQPCLGDPERDQEKRMKRMLKRKAPNVSGFGMSLPVALVVTLTALKATVVIVKT